MGAGLAKAAYAVAARAGIDHAPTRVFVFMALAPLDSDPTPTYFGGREALAASLGASATASGFRAVERAVSTLTQRRLISVARKGAPGRNTQYRILDGAGLPLTVDTHRSAWGDSDSAHGERRVNNAEHPTLSRRTPDAERSKHPTLSVDLRRKEEEEEEPRASAPPVNNSLPARTCRRHKSWEHSNPCRACAADRRAAEAYAAARRPETMSPRVLDCGVGRHSRLADGTCIRCENRDPLWEVA